MRTSTLQAPAPTSVAATSFGIRLAYSGGNLGKSVVWSAFESFLLFYLVRFAGFDPLVAGGLLAALMFAAAGADVVVAYFADRGGRPDALARLILVGAPLGGIGFWLIFAARLDGPAIVAAVILCRVGYSLCDIGHNTLLVRVAIGPRDATSVSGLRMIFSAAGTAIVGLASVHILSIADPGDQRAAFAGCALVGGALYIATLMAATWATRGIPAPRTATRRIGPAAMLSALWHTPAYRRLLALVGVQVALVPMFARALPFFGVAVHGDAGWGGSALLVITVAQAGSLPAWIMLGRALPPQSTLTVANALIIVAMLLLVTLPQAGPVPLALIGIAQAGMNIAIWALLATSIRTGMAAGSTAEALPMGLFLAVVKGATGIGNLLFASAIAGHDWHCTSCAPSTSFLLATIGLPLLGCVAILAMNARPAYKRTT
ncbi:MFS transporter [Sphingomonas arantia]|uniref:MFS transporter n=1 Tax=Sphingomonas arantia TaxID=1460676 RepID=A0ABW4TUN8_9SPHN